MDQAIGGIIDDENQYGKFLYLLIAKVHITYIQIHVLTIILCSILSFVQPMSLPALRISISQLLHHLTQKCCELCMVLKRQTVNWLQRRMTNCLQRRTWYENCHFKNGIFFSSLLPRSLKN